MKPEGRGVIGMGIAGAVTLNPAGLAGIYTQAKSGRDRGAGSN